MKIFGSGLVADFLLGASLTFGFKFFKCFWESFSKDSLLFLITRFQFKKQKNTSEQIIQSGAVDVGVDDPG